MASRKMKLAEQTELTGIQKRFCLHVSVLNNVAAAARLTGISERTAHRWYDMPLAQEYIHGLHEQAFDAAMALLERATLSAAQMLNEALNSDHIENNLKVKAAQLILDYGIEARKMRTIQTRLDALEERISMHDIVVKGEVIE